MLSNVGFNGLPTVCTIGLVTARCIIDCIEWLRYLRQWYEHLVCSSYRMASSVLMKSFGEVEFVSPINGHRKVPANNFFEIFMTNFFFVFFIVLSFFLSFFFFSFLSTAWCLFCLFYTLTSTGRYLLTFSLK